MLEICPGPRKVSGDRSYQKKGNFSRQVLKARKGHPTPGPKEILSLNLAVFASFARDIPIVWLRLRRARPFVAKSLL
jgi:hypothetical protein